MTVLLTNSNQLVPVGIHEIQITELTDQETKTYPNQETEF